MENEIVPGSYYVPERLQRKVALCPKCNFAVDTKYDPEGVFGLCLNPDCGWVLNLKDDIYKIDIPPEILKELHFHQHIYPEAQSQAQTQPQKSITPRGTMWCHACQRHVAPTKPFNWLLLIVLIFSGIGWAFYLLYYFLQSMKCPICRAPLE